MLAPDAAELARRKGEREAEALRLRLGATQAVTAALASSDTVDEVADAILRAVGALGFDAGSLWLSADAGSRLVRARSWSVPGVAASDIESLSAQRSLAPGEGLVGRTFQSARVGWIRNEHGSPSLSAPEVTTTFRGAVAFPIQWRGEVRGVFEFHALHPFTLDDELGGVLEAIGLQVGAHFERVETRESLRESSALRAAIVEASPDCIVTLDANGRISFANPAAEAALGYSARELVDGDVHETIHASYAEEPECELLRALRTGAVFRSDDEHFTRKDGSTFPASFATSPIVTSGRIVGAVVAFHDITQKKRAEVELEDSRRHLVMNEKLSALGTLVSGVAHELRTPLTYIANNLFLVQVRLDSASKNKPDVKKLLDDIGAFSQSALEGVDRINALVKDLRPFTQSDAGQRIETSLHEVVAGAVELFRATHRGRVEVVAELDATPVVLVDRGQIQRVVINLLSNAADAMPHGGAIHVRTRGHGDRAELVVEDEGDGIPPDIESRIFDPFFTTKPEGTGLGLAITRRIIERHGGRITFETRPRAGTSFAIEFPAAALPAAQARNATQRTTP